MVLKRRCRVLEEGMPPLVFDKHMSKRLSGKGSLELVGRIKAVVGVRNACVLCCRGRKYSHRSCNHGGNQPRGMLLESVAFANSMIAAPRGSGNAQRRDGFLRGASKVGETDFLQLQEPTYPGPKRSPPHKIGGGGRPTPTEVLPGMFLWGEQSQTPHRRWRFGVSSRS